MSENNDYTESVDNNKTNKSGGRSGKIVLIALVSVVAVAIIICAITILVPIYHYKKGTECFDNGDYASAVSHLTSAGDYQDAPSRLQTAQLALAYSEGQTAFDQEDYSLAIQKFTEAAGYNDADDRLVTSQLALHYQTATNAFNSGDFALAETEYREAGDYLDASDRVTLSVYSNAVFMQEAQRYNDAAQLFIDLGDYNDSHDRAFNCAVCLVENEDYDSALTILENSDFDNGAAYIHYARAMKALAEEDYSTASYQLSNCLDLYDASDIYPETTYTAASNLFDEGQYNSAKTYFGRIPDYRDSSYMAQVCDLMVAESYYQEGQLRDAQNAYNELPEELEYNGILVSDRVSALNSHQDFIDLLDYWMISESYRKVTRSLTYYQYYYENSNAWGRFNISSCVINDDGSVTVSGYVEYYVFLNFSFYNYAVDYDSVRNDFELTANSVSGIRGNVSDYAVLSYSNGNFRLEYNRTDTSSGYTDTYLTRCTYERI